MVGENPTYLYMFSILSGKFSGILIKNGPRARKPLNPLLSVRPHLQENIGKSSPKMIKKRQCRTGFESATMTIGGAQKGPKTYRFMYGFCSFPRGSRKRARKGSINDSLEQLLSNISAENHEITVKIS